METKGLGSKASPGSDHYVDIESSPDFKWEETKIPVFDPYKTPYRLGLDMGTITTSDLILMDESYLEHISKRKQLVQDFRNSVIGVEEGAHAAVKEMYSWLTSTYLPIRYPTMFELTESTGSPASIRNLVDGEAYPLEPPQSMEDALGILGSLIDEDLLFMLPSKNKGEDEYTLLAFVNCFANGPHTKERLGKGMSDIHGALPGYREHLAKQVNDWFRNLKTGRIVKRLNWAITDDKRMFVPEGHVPFKNKTESDFDIEKTYVRSERQTLRRLPHSGAIVFSLRTYIYTIATIKEAGYGQKLLDAIDGLRQSKVEGIIDYKQLAKWENGVKQYLEE
ncbi:hypothetical protein GGR51DRAFT_54874 [Nemania sp. FL0031]|nr:hypothetical protein GGR51DRAFT_54874 [Nemania sp. FL0031]